MPAPKVFISYRREDCEATAGWLNSLLEEHFGPGNVFFDVDSIHPGRNYVEYLDEQVSQCNVLLALIGKRWITAENKDGGLRLFDEHDFVRKEIASAMDQGVTVIPLLVERAEMPTPDQLPDVLHKFCEQQATHVRPSPDFKKDVAKLIKDLERIELTEDKPSPDEQAIEMAIRFELKQPAGELATADLEKVTKLDLSGNQLTDVSALAELTLLERLNLNANQLAEVSALAELAQLTDLKLDKNQLARVNALAKLTQLKVLSLRSNNLSDISALAGLTHLEKLYLTNNQCSDVSSLMGLKRLKVLGLHNNNLTDVSALANLSHLEELRLGLNQLTDVSALAELKQLWLLYLDNNKLTDVSALTQLRQLKVLSIRYNHDLTKAKLDKLQKSLPNCSILRK